MFVYLPGSERWINLDHVRVIAPQKDCLQLMWDHRKKPHSVSELSDPADVAAVLLAMGVKPTPAMPRKRKAANA